MNLLFWNLGCTDNPQTVCECIMEADADIAVFAEWRSLDLDRLKALLSEHYQICLGVAPDAKVIAVVKNAINVVVHREQMRYVIYGVACGTDDAFVLSGIHLEDKRSHPSLLARYATVRDLMEDIGIAKIELSCNDAVIIGDFNMEPYDELMATPDAFNAVFFKDVLKGQKGRRWKGRDYEFLYSPMLCNYSEEGPQYGSFYSSGLDSETYWHCLDQVLVTAGLADGITEVRHLRSVGSASLLRRVRPNDALSDHLPLFVKLSTRTGGAADGK